MLNNRKNGYWDYTDSGELAWRSDNFVDFDEYEYSVYAVKWCVCNLIDALKEYLPLNTTEKTMVHLFKTHLLSREVEQKFNRIIEFELNIDRNRKLFTSSPDSFKKKYCPATFMSAAIDIL